MLIKVLRNLKYGAWKKALEDTIKAQSVIIENHEN